MVMTEVRCSQLSTLWVNNLSMNFTGWVLHPLCVWLTYSSQAGCGCFQSFCVQCIIVRFLSTYGGVLPLVQGFHLHLALGKLASCFPPDLMVIKGPGASSQALPHTHTIATYMFCHVRKTTCTPHHQHHAPLACPDEHISHSTHTNSHQGACGHHMACPQW